MRYEWGGEPVAFHAKGKIYDLLWPKQVQPKAGQGVTVTKGQFKSGTSAANERQFSARAVPPCPFCGSERVFEAQLMPNLINLLRAEQIQTADGTPDTDPLASSAAGDPEAKRKAEIEQALGRRLPGKDAQEVKFDARSGLVWSTAFVFVCQKDCVAEEAKEGWREEVVWAQFEDEQ